MNEQNRQRLGRIAARHASRKAQGGNEAENDAAFLAMFARVRDEVLRPVMEDAGAQLKAAGYDFRIVNRGREASPVVDFHVLVEGRGDSKDTIRFFAYKDSGRGWQVIAEIELTRSPMELTRFEAAEEMRRDVIEQLVVDAVAQLFASTPAKSWSEPSPVAAAPNPAPKDAHARQETPALPADSPVGVRALVVERLRAGLVLHGLDLVGADLHGLDFTGAVMPALDLRHANLQGCLLIEARLMAARMDGADLTDANLVGANLARADLSHAILLRARLDGATLDGAVGVSLASTEQATVCEPKAPIEKTSEPVRAEAVPAGEPPPEPPLALSSEAHEARWARWAGAPRMGETEEVNVAALRDLPLPFVKGPPAPEFFEVADAASAHSRARSSRGRSDETMPLPVLSIPASSDGREPRARAGQHAPTVALPAMSFPAATLEGDAADMRTVAPPAITIEQYAALCAELAASPGKSERTFEQYGLTSPSMRTDLDEAFAQRFRADPGLQRRWQALVAHYSDWFRRQGAR